MPSFDARLRLPGRQKLPVGVIVDVSDERLKLKSGGRSLGDWPLDELSVVSLPDGFHIRLEDEEMVLTVADPDEFLGHLRKIATEPEVVIDDRSISGRLKPIDPEEQYSDLRRAIDRLASAIDGGTVPPNQVFVAWLGLLKEMNRRHGQGQIPSALYGRLNTELLDMLPVPGE